ncbi:hypothetical protein CPB86DRAFT_694537, partial [Serendipita vermifera]
ESGVWLFISFASVSIPGCASSRRIVSTCPFLDAHVSGVPPSLSLALTFTSCRFSSNSTISLSPVPAAHDRGVR